MRLWSCIVLCSIFVEMIKLSDLCCNQLSGFFFILYNFQVTDDKNVCRQIIQTTFRKDMNAMTHVACVPLRLSTSWERISINLAKVTHALFGTKYVETSKIKVSVGRFYRWQHCDMYLLPISALFPSDLRKLSHTKSVFHRQTVLRPRAAR